MQGATIASAPDAFLDTIPEDQSVAQQRVTEWTIASPSAASASGLAVAPGSSDRIKRKKTQGPSSVSGVSDANAIIEAGEEPERSPTAKQSSASKARRSCTIQKLAFYVTLSALVIGIALGVYFIVSGTDDDAGANDDVDTNGSEGPDLTTSPPDLEITFPPGFVLTSSEFPSPSPSFDIADVALIDQTLLKVSQEALYYDSDTPQGKCRYWLTHEDALQLRVAFNGEAAVQQRYILCVLYESTNGPTWDSAVFRDDTLHECDWTGISCDLTNDYVAVVYLKDSNLQGSIPDEIAMLSTLEWLVLSNNEITGTIPPALMELPALFALDLALNEISGSIPSAGAAPLEALYLDGNLLEGMLPYFGTLQNLRVQRNLLSEYDERYTTSAVLEKWKMYDNVISGALPDLWSAPNLNYVDFASNVWTGTIPTSLWNLPSLESLVLHDAQLTGTLPPNTTSTHWRHLWLHGNQLEGTVPTTFGENWTNFTELLLHQNLLTGIIGPDHCDHLSTLDRFEMDCNLDTIQCDCCTACHGET